MRKDGTEMREETNVTEVAGTAAEAREQPRERLAAEAFDAVTLFDADGVDAAQYAETIQRKTPLEPERLLLLALLEDALSCYRKYLFARTAKRQTEFREAEEWIFDTEDTRFVSFDNLCGILGIEPSYLRRGLREWKADKVAARASAMGEAA